MTFTFSPDRFPDANQAGSHFDRQSTFGYYSFVKGNLVTWQGEKQNAYTQSIAEAKYQAKAHTASKMLWVCSPLHDMDIDAPTPMQIVSDNQATIVFYMSIPNISGLTITLFEIY